MNGGLPTPPPSDPGRKATSSGIFECECVYHHSFTPYWRLKGEWSSTGLRVPHGSRVASWYIYDLRMCSCTGVSVNPSLCVPLQCQQPRTWPVLCWIPALSATGRTCLLFQRKRRESKPFSTLGETLHIQCHETYRCTVCSVPVCLST